MRQETQSVCVGYRATLTWVKLTRWGILPGSLITQQFFVSLRRQWLLASILDVAIGDVSNTLRLGQRLIISHLDALRSRKNPRRLLRGCSVASGARCIGSISSWAWRIAVSWLGGGVLVYLGQVLGYQFVWGLHCLVILTTLTSRVQDRGLIELSFHFLVRSRIEYVTHWDVAGWASFLLGIVVKLSLNQVLRTSSTSFCGGNRLNLYVVNLSALSGR